MVKKMDMAEGEDKLLGDMLEVIRFTEGVSAKLHRVLDEAKIYQVVKEEFAKSDRYTAGILLLDGDGASLKLAEVSMTPSKLKVLERASGLQAKEYVIKLSESSICRQVVREGKAVHANVSDIIREFLPRPLAYLISKTMGYDKQFSILTPLRKHGKVIGVLAMSCTDLCEYFTHSVENLALHISTALELADKHAQRKRAVQALKRYHDHLGELVEERTGELKAVNEKLREEVTERKQAGEALRKIEQEKLAILNSMSELVVYQDTEHRILWTNKAAAESVALSIEQLAGRHCYEIWHQSNKPCVGCPVAKARETGKSQVAEMTTPDGRAWFIRGYPVRDANENLVSVVEVVLDITERKQAEGALRESREKFQKMFESVTDGISVIDLNGAIIEVNQRMVEMHGFTSKDELLGRNASELVAPRDRKRIAANMRKAVKEGIARGVEYTLLKADGTELAGELSTSVIRDALGKAVAHITIARDITERKQADEALQAEKNKLQSLVDAMEYGLTIQDTEYNIIYEGTLQRTIFGDHLGEKCYRVYEGKEKICDGCPVEKAFKDGKSHTTERKTVTPSGEVFFWENTASPIRDAKGRIVSCLEIARNITERKQADEALQVEKNKLQSLTDAMEDSLTIRDTDYNIIYQNEPVRKVWGDRTGEKCYRVYEGKEKICEGCPAEKAFKDGKSHVAERKTVEPSGEVTFWENTANPIRDAKGRVVSCLEIARNITERKQAEEALRESQKFSSSLLESSPNPILVINPDTSIRYINPAFEKLTGFSLDEIVGRKAPHPWWPKEQIEEIAAAFKKHMAMGGRRSERNFQKKNGERFWVVLNSAPVMQDGKPIYLIMNWLDVTERKQAEEALADEATRRRILVDESRDGIVVLDENSKVYEANQRFAEMLGYTPEEVRELHTWDWDTQWTREELLEMARKVDAAGYHLETHHRRKDGTTIDVEISINGAVCAGQKLIFCVCRDVTERKQAEEQLQESEDYLKTIFNASTGGILVIEPETHKIVDVNPAIIKMIGADREEIIGRVCHQFVCPAEKGKCPVTDLKQTVDTKECILLNASGEEMPALKSVVPITRYGRQYLLELIFDITERKRAEEKEKQLQQELYLAQRLAAVGELAAGVAHEINNPLTGVLGFSQRLMRKSTDEQVSHDLEIIHSEAKRAAEVVQSLLTFARRRQPKKEYANINDIVQKTLELRAYALQTGNIEVVTTLAPGLPRIMADFPQMQEVFLNIILNAEQAMSEARGRGKLVIKTQRLKKYVRISFADDGPGISTENLGKVFDPFFTTREGKGGTGLGLSACHGIVTEHGGRIYARSKGRKGATFFVELPLSPVEAAAAR